MQVFVLYWQKMLILHEACTFTSACIPLAAIQALLLQVAKKRLRYSLSFLQVDLITGLQQPKSLPFLILALLLLLSLHLTRLDEQPGVRPKNGSHPRTETQELCCFCWFVVCVFVWFSVKQPDRNPSTRRSRDPRRRFTWSVALLSPCFGCHGALASLNDTRLTP